MNKSQLLAAITAAFQAEPHPGDENVARDDSGFSPEHTQGQSGFGEYAWQQVPLDVMASQRTKLAALSDLEFKYYLPAFMCALLRDNTFADIAMSNVLDLLKLPVEVDVKNIGEGIQHHQAAEELSSDDLDEVLQKQLVQSNKAINRFVARATQFTRTQAQVIAEFLLYVRGESGRELWTKTAGLAIQRYWFQFEENADAARA